MLNPDQLPKSIMDLTEPEWKGKWAVLPSGANFQAIAEAMLWLKGEKATADWLKDSAAIYRWHRRGDERRQYGKGSSSGDFATTTTSAIRPDRRKKNERGASFLQGPERRRHRVALRRQRVEVIPTKEQALAFIKWVVGNGGQDVLKTGTSFEYAVGDGADSNPQLPPLTTLEAPAVDPSSFDTGKVTQLLIDANIL